jgi:hypothetical protein
MAANHTRRPARAAARALRQPAVSRLAVGLWVGAVLAAFLTIHLLVIR